ncbi:MAG: APC family permease [Candidatus Bathyarchaeia archaeon]
MTEEIVFVRRATGLVRQIGVLSVMSICFVFTFLGAHITPFYAILEYPGSNVPLTYVLAPIMMMWSMFSAMFLVGAMPRTSNDYVAVSRTLHPILAYMGSIGMFLAIVPWVAGATMFGLLLLGNGFSTIGQAVGNAGWIDIGTLLVANQPAIFALILIAIVIYFIISVLGLNVTTKVINAVFIFYIIGMALGLIVFAWYAAQGPAAVAASYDASFGTGAWKEVERVAMANGWSDMVKEATGDSSIWGWPGPWLWGATGLALIPAAFAVWGYEIANVAGGEIKEPLKSYPIGAGLAFLVMSIFMIAYNALVFWGYGSFISQFSYVMINGFSDQLTMSPVVQPSLSFFAVAPFAKSSPILAFIVMLSISAAWLAVPIIYLLILSRMMLAWSFDRFGPGFFASVNDRFHTPHWSLLIVSIIGALYAYAFVYAPYITLLNSLPGALIRYLLLSMACMILPFARPEIFERGFTWKVGKVPLATIVGAISTVMLTFLIVVNFTLLANDWPSIFYQVGWISFAALVFIAYWAYNKSKGIDVAAIWKEIPPA